MGMNLLGSSCSTNAAIATAPNPSPSRWTLLSKVEFPHGYALMVRYHDCTNFEGVKVMVYTGHFKERDILDPHFSNLAESPIARFKPTIKGWGIALMVAKSLKSQGDGKLETQ